LTTNETHAGAVTVDWGDVQMLQAMGDAAELFIYTTYSWNLDFQLATATNLLGSDGSFEAFLTNFPSLLTTTSTADLPAAKTAFSNAITTYFTASQFIRSRPPGEVRLFNLDTNNAPEELQFRETLSNLLASLNGPVPLTTSPGNSVSAQAFFSGNFTPRSYLPEFQGNDFVWDSFPDTTFGGAITGLTEPAVGKGFQKRFHAETVLDLPGTSLAVLYDFTGFSDQTGVVQGPDGNLYGTMMTGGPYSDSDVINGIGYGYVFQVTPDGQFTDIYDFGSQQDDSGNPEDGAYPNALVLGSDGNLYGTTQSGGYSQFTYRAGTNTVTIQNYTSGTIFRITTAGQLTTLYNFGNAGDQDASTPFAALVEGTNGQFYGTTESGGTNGNSAGIASINSGGGIVFAISTNSAFTLLNSFPVQFVQRYTNDIPKDNNKAFYYGQSPGAPLVEASDGNFYGTTTYGGILGTNIFFNYNLNVMETNIVAGYGTIFRITPAGQLSLLYIFGTNEDENGDPLDGAVPNGLIQGIDGNLYGTTQYGGPNDDNIGMNGGIYGTSGNGDGTLFSISPTVANSFTTLVSFDENYSDGYNPIGSLLPGPNGGFYGVASAGGANKRGAVFMYSTNGTVTNLVWLTKSSGGYGGNLQAQANLQSFTLGNDNSFPVPSVLTEGLDGALYGTTTDGGANGYGTVYELGFGIPLITWTNPAPIVVGTPLSTNQLDATANVPGTFLYNPPAGTVLNVGTNTLTTVFTPTDTIDYSSATDSVSLLVLPANTGTLITFDDLVSSATGTPITNGYAGLNWTNFDTLDTPEYTTQDSGYITGTVSSPNMAFNADGDPASISSATPFTLTSGYFTAAWDNGLILEVVGINGETTEYDTNYVLNTSGPLFITFPNLLVTEVDFSTEQESQFALDNLEVNGVASGPSVQFGANPESGLAPLAVQFSSPTNDSSGNAIVSWSWNFGDGAGTSTNENPLYIYTNAGVFVPTLSVSNSLGALLLATGPSVTVTQAAPVLVWTNPAPVVYGTALSGVQLDATTTSNIPGSYAYSPPAGTVPLVGSDVLTVVFTPNNTNLYSSATDSVSLVVMAGPLTVTASNVIWLVGQPFPVFSGLITGLAAADSNYITATYSSDGTASSPVGTYPIVPVLVDPQGRLVNYTVTTNDGVLTISKGVALTAPANGSSFTTNQAFTVSAIENLTNAIQSLDLYNNGVLLAGTNGAAISTVLSNLVPGSYRLTAVVTPSSGPAVTSAAVEVTVNAPGTALINFDALDTSLGVMNDGALSSYLGGFGITITNVTFGTSLEAATGSEAVSQGGSSSNNLPVPSSSPNLFTQAGSAGPVGFTLLFGAPLQSFGFTRVELDTTNGSTISHPGWTASILDASNNVLESVSEPLLVSTNDIPARQFTLVGANIASVRFTSDSQGGTAVFGGALLDDLILGSNEVASPITVTLAQPGGGTAPDNIQLGAAALDSYTNIAYVAFYSGPTLIGVASNTPYGLIWSNVLNGTYTLTAQVVDAAGYAQSSAPVLVTVAIGGSSIVVNFDALDAGSGPVTGGALSSYLASPYGVSLTSNSPGTAVAAEDQDNVAGGGFVLASSPPNLLTQIGSNGPVSFTAGFSNLLSAVSFTRPELVANPFVTHPAWQVEAFDALGQLLAVTNAGQISSSTNVPAQIYTLSNTAAGGGIASVEFSSEGTGFTTVNALLLDDLVLTTGSNLPPAVMITTPTNGQVFADLSDIAIDAAAVSGGTVTGVAFYYNSNNLAGAASGPFSISWNAPASGTYVLTAVATNSAGLLGTSAPVTIAVETNLAFVLQPTNQTVGVSNSATFSVITAPAAGVTYQWLSNGIPLPGATLSSNTAPPAGAPGSYTYSVIASLGGGSLASSNAVLTVLGPPTINSILPGTNVSVPLGSNITLSVNASDSAGIAFYFQWQRNGQFIAGATNTFYTISNAQPSQSGDYQVLVANAVASQESPTFAVAVNFLGTNPPVTTNDFFASSLAINLTNGPVGGNNVNSPAAGELAVIAGKPAGKFLWYNWTAGFTGVVTLSTLGSGFDTLLGVYTGDTAAGLTPLAEDDDAGGYFTSQLSFNCVAGTTYQIAVAGFKGASGNVVLSSPAFTLLDANYLNTAGPQILQQPAASQIVQAGDTVTLSVAASNAALCQWYFGNAPVTGGNDTNLVISNFPPGAAGVYFVRLANGIGSVQSEPAVVEITTENQNSSSSNNVAVDKFGDEVDLSQGDGNAPEDDRRKDAGGDTGGFTLSQSFNTTGATKEEGEPNHAGQPGGASYWYSYTAPAGSLVQFDTKGSSFNTILAVYTGPGDSFQTLVNVGAAYTTNYLQQGQPIVLVSNLTAVTKYYIAIDGYLGASGAAKLNIVLNQVTNITAAPGALALTNNKAVLAISFPGNNYLTTDSNLLVRGTVRGLAGVQEPLASYVQLAVNTNSFHAALDATNFAAVLVTGPGGEEEAVAQESITWSSNVTLQPGANVITAQSVSVQSTNLEDDSPPVTHTVFYVTSLPSPSVRSTLTLQTNGDGKITGQRDQASLEINKVYTVRAVPVGNWVFSNWTAFGDAATNTLGALPSLSFLMSSNLVLQANFVTNPFTALAGVYDGLFSPSNGVSEESSGFLTATVPASSRGAYSARLLLDGGSYPFSGAFDLSLQAGTTVPRSGKTPLSVALQLTNDQLTGSIRGYDSNGSTSILVADRAFNAKTNPGSNYAGRYTLVLPPGANAPSNAPAGYGYATLTNSAAGHVALSGRLADGTAFSQSVPVATNGNIPLYASLYARKGSLQGWLTLASNPNTLLGSNLAWIKVSDTASFTNTNLTLLGSFYLPGQGLNLTNATLTLSNAALGALTYSNLTLDGNKLVNNGAGDLSGLITPATGVLTLTFRPPGATANTVARGVLLPDQPATNAAGWFLDNNLSGFFLLQQ
jgi:hypothetical protein